MYTNSRKTVRLIGNCWTTTGEVSKMLVIDNGKIISLTNVPDPIPEMPGVTTIKLQDDQVIFPGLINLHTHVGYNILPIWDNTTVWKNRFQWRASSKYATDIKGLINYITKEWPKDSTGNFSEQLIRSILPVVKKTHLEAFADFESMAFAALTEVEKAHAITSEIQAVAGGTTILQQNIDLDDQLPNQKTFVIRNTDNPVDLGITKPQTINSVVDFFRPTPGSSGNPEENTSQWRPTTQGGYTNFVNSVNNNNSIFHSTLVHVGEGKAGFYTGSEADFYTRNEINTFVDLLKKDIGKTENLKKANLSITHGNGIDLSNKAVVDFLRAHNISLVWSPLSNFLLYRDTVDIRKLLDKGIRVCLGSDWSPSGSKHVLDELRFSAFLNERLKLGIAFKDLFDMVSTNAAAALGISGFGELKKGAYADLFVYTKSPGRDALTSLLTGSDHQVSFVMINGRIVFGLTDYFDLLQVDYQSFPDNEGGHVAKRGFSINSAVQFNLISSINIMDELIQRYCETVIKKTHLHRTRFMSSDDTLYSDRIEQLKQSII